MAPLDQDQFRQIVGSFPTGVTVVTTMGGDGRPKGMTSNAFASVSADPPLLLVCVGKQSRSLPALLESKSFVVHFLDESGEDMSGVFASRADDKFVDLAWRPSTVAGGAPILQEGVVAYAECTTHQEIDAGDHIIIIGELKAGRRWIGSPLMYYQRQYGGWRQPIGAFL